MEEVFQKAKLKSVIESLIFTAEKPIPIEEIKKLFPEIDTLDLKESIETSMRELEARGGGVRIIEIAGGYQMVTAAENAPELKEFYRIKHTEKLSRPSLETLAIVAYKQPVTRIDVESIRGVNTDGVIKNLLEKGLIRIVGRKEVIGRPYVYGTSRHFLDYFGLKSLEELPKIEEFAQKDLLLDMNLVSQDAEITPLTREEEDQLKTAASPQEVEDENQKNT